MDSQSLTVLIAIASLVTGVLLCWLVMRGRISAAAAQAKPEVQAELAVAKEHVRSLEKDRQLAVANYEELKLQAAKSREALDLARKEQSQLTERASQVSTLEARLLTLQGQEKAAQAAAALAKSEAQAELAKAREHVRSLEKNQQLAATNYQELKLQAAKSREALDLAKKEQTQLAERASQVSTLEATLLMLQDQEKANQHALLQRSASDAESAESLQRASARLVALEDENTVLKHDVASISASLQEQKARPATLPAQVTQATQLPVLEEEVIVLQTLAKTIQLEFQLLAELQRTFTLTSTTVQEFSDSPEPHEDASMAT